jgi:PAS domain S-box-containing protein
MCPSTVPSKHPWRFVRRRPQRIATSEAWKRSASAQQLKEAFLAEAQQLSHTGSFGWNVSTGEIFWSEETYRIFEYEQGTRVTVDAVLQRVHSEDRARVQGAIDRASTDGEAFHIEHRLQMPDGSVKHLRVVAHAVVDRPENLQFAGAVMDVTAAKEAERALKQSETRYQNLFQAMAVAFFEIDYTRGKQLLRTWRDAGVRDFRSHFKENPHLIREIMRATRVVDVNDQTVALFGRGNKEELLTSVEAFWPEESLDDYVDAVLATIEGDDEFSIETRVRRLDGTIFDARFTLRYATEDKTRGLVGVIDITQRRQAEEALRESEQRLRSAIDGIPGLVGVLTPDGNVEAVNRQILEYCGQSLEELRNWGTNGTVHPEDLPHVVEVFTKSIAAGIPYQIEQRLRRFDGEYRWFDNRGIPVRDDSGRVVRWYVLLTDVEDRTQALARVQQMQSDFAHMNRLGIMGELAASLSHEIAQPIASVRNNTRAAQNFLDLQSPDLGEVREALACAVSDADRAGDIIGRIRDQIRKAPPQKAHFDLNLAISEVIALARSAIVRNSVAVRTRLADGLPPIHGDRVQLQQVILNLILNAVEAMSALEAGRELSISAQQTQSDGGVLVAVHDSGPGIDPKHFERVFQTFYTTKPNGTGMGLPICRSIISAHGGRLWAEANEPSGAVLQFTLPGTHA